MFKKILVPVDFSECSNQLVKNLPKIVKEFGSEEVFLIKVINTFKFVGVSSGFDFTTWLKDEEIKTKNKLGELIEYLKAHGVKADFVKPIPVGDPVSEIIKATKNLKVSLIVLSSRGKSVFKEILLGSVSEGVLRLSNVPILILKCKLEKIDERKACTLLLPENIFKKVIYAHDLTPYSDGILECIKNIESLKNGELILLHVIEDHEVDLKSVQKRLKEIASKITAKRIDVVVKFGSPSKEIIKTAIESKANIIMVGSRGVSFLESLVLGSTSESVVRYSEIPVFIYKEERKENKSK